MVLMVLNKVFDPKISTTDNQYFYRKATAAEAQMFIKPVDLNINYKKEIK